MDMINCSTRQQVVTGISPELPHKWRLWLAITVVSFILLLLLIRPLNYVDSFNYAKHIADTSHGNLEAAANPFFDFGHLLWRPLGLIFWLPIREPLRPLFHGDDILSAGAVLIALSIVGGLCGAVFLFLTIARSTASAMVAGVTTIGYLCTNALLFYTPTGMAYVAGIACQIAAFHVLQRALSRANFTFLSGLLCGLLMGLSIVLWFPYILAAGGVFCYALFAEESDDVLPAGSRVRGLIALAAGTTAVLLLAYGIVMVHAGFTTVHGTMEWISRSRYGKKPDRGFLRMLGGIPRGFFSLGEGSVAWRAAHFP